MKRLMKIMVAGVVSGGILLFFCLESLGDGLLHVYYLNIGQGDGILVRTPSSEYMLIDGGPDDKVLQEISAVMPFYTRTIDVMMLSHPHADHVDGLIDVLERYEVKHVMITGVSYGYAGYEKFLDVAREREVPITFVNGRNDYKLGNMVVDIVYPFHSLAGSHFENVNNSSIAFRLLYGERSFYFSGDLEIEGERKLVETNLDLYADVFKAGHHGSRTSSSEDLLDRVQPRWAVISCGVDNPFKHPHPETIAHLQERGIAVYRTDLDGRVKLVSDGQNITIQPAQ